MVKCLAGGGLEQSIIKERRIPMLSPAQMATRVEKQTATILKLKERIKTLKNAKAAARGAKAASGKTAPAATKATKARPKRRAARSASAAA
jgi:hypothetical protein